MRICIIHMIFIHIKIVLYFIYILHAILKKSLSNFSFLNFCSLIKNENIKRLGFYTLHITRVFSYFQQLKQLNKIKNTCKYCDLLEVRSA